MSEIAVGGSPPPARHQMSICARRRLQEHQVCKPRAHRLCLCCWSVHPGLHARDTHAHLTVFRHFSKPFDWHRLAQDEPWRDVAAYDYPPAAGPPRTAAPPGGPPGNGSSPGPGGGGDGGLSNFTKALIAGAFVMGMGAGLCTHPTHASYVFSTSFSAWLHSSSGCCAQVCGSTAKPRSVRTMWPRRRSSTARPPTRRSAWPMGTAPWSLTSASSSASTRAPTLTICNERIRGCCT